MAISTSQDLVFTIADFLAFIEQRKPKDHANLLRILRIVVPALAAVDGLAPPHPEDDTFTGFADKLAATRLLDCLVKDGRTWAGWLIAADPELERVAAYRKDYRRCLVRCLDHAIATRHLTTSTRGVAPEWQIARNLLANVLAYDAKRLKARLDNGETELFGHSLVDKPARTIQRYQRSMLDSFNEFARYMTGIGIASPREVRPEHFYGSPVSWYAVRKKANPAAMMAYSRGRFAWAILQHLKPEWNLADLPTPREDRKYSLPEADLPPLAARLCELIRALPLRTGEMNVRHLLCLLGVLALKLGLDIEGLCALLDDPLDLAFVLFGGYPPTANGRVPDEEVRRIFVDRTYLYEVVDGIHGVNTLVVARGNRCRANPLLGAYEAWMLANGRHSMLEVGLKQFHLLGVYLLRTDETQRGWIKAMIKATRKTRSNRLPSSRSKKKQAIGADPGLWLKLVGARSRLAEHVTTLREAMNAAAVDPKLTDEQKRHARMRWATGCRDQLLYGMLLGFLLRKSNLQRLRIGETIFPEERRISLPPVNSKSTRWINKNFYQSGPFADLAALLDTYLLEARPVLLAGRPDTPYLFLPVPSGPESHDEEGFLSVGRELLSRVLRDLGREFLSDVLPPSLGDFTPHLVRHAFSRHAQRGEDGKAVASQGLSDAPGTIDQHYSETNREWDDRVHEHMEGLDHVDRPHPRRLSSRRRRALRAEITSILRTGDERSRVDALERLVERYSGPA